MPDVLGSSDGVGATRPAKADGTLSNFMDAVAGATPVPHLLDG
jgi:hypothetical protein